MEKTEIGTITPKEYIKSILKLPSQDFMIIEYESGERKVHKKKT